MGNISLRPEPEHPSRPYKEAIGADSIVSEYYVEELWAALDQTLQRSGCGVGSDTSGTLDMNTYKIGGAPAPVREVSPESAQECQPSPGTPGPPEYLPEMKDAEIMKNTIHALSPRIVAVHGPTATGKSTVFPLAITHWAEHAEGLKRGLTVCAQPRRILAQQLCERVRSNRKMGYNDKTVGYMIARETFQDSSSKLLHCTEAIVALMMQLVL